MTRHTIHRSARGEHRGAAFVLTLCLLPCVAGGCDDEVTSSGTHGTGGGAGVGGSTTSNGPGAGAGGGGAQGVGGQGVGGSQTMGASEACMACVAGVYGEDADCMATIQACDADPGCDAWKNCNEACFTSDDRPGCYDACDQEFPHDGSLSAPLLACTCDSCAELCVASCS